MPDDIGPGSAGKVSAPTVDRTAPDPAAAPITGQLTVQAPPKKPPPTDAAPAKRPWWIWAGLVVLIIAAGVVWYIKPWVAKGVAVTVETVVPAPLIRVLAVNGRVAPLHLVDVKPTVGGAVLAVLVDEGDGVAAGDVLARVDPVQQQATVRQAIAGLDAGLVAQAKAAAGFARAKALGGTIPRNALDDAASAQQTADQEVARLTALFDQTQIELEKYTLAAPVAGTILVRHAEVGQVVDPATVVFTLADLGQLVVETDVDEAYAAAITIGLAAVLQLNGGSDKLDGHVSFVAPQVDAATGGLAVKIAFDVPVVVPVGLTVTANIVVDQTDAAIAIPRAAVVTDASGSAVFVAAAGVALRRPVTIVDWPADRLQVTSGLVAGDVVITDATGLSDGVAITVTSPAVVAP